ncbi:aminoglycoside phosphotransferase family protein [Hydrogenophaga sp. A37]|uniref:aminoglycoside phosphotransferase family protein n=1 Tax=Hydrogenophaga sp. A37 TaxID=1945864 RepID=UPI0009869BBC|nr:phosphotransferase [Hydrogenophaga sp. A37]OOG82027.1 aminoglycoside phosphotransferase [Hydrogenophaga sp. A37]
MTPSSPAVAWTDPQREAAFNAWLQGLASTQGLVPATLRTASADASFRRYLRVDTVDGDSRIVMDAPPDKENCKPFVHVADLMRDAGLLVPQVLAWDEPQGFMLLSDLGTQTMMEQIDPLNPAANHARYLQATDALLAWQMASKPGVLPAYDEPLLRRELQLFPDWYLAQHRQATLQGKDAETLSKAFDSIVKRCLSAPSVYVHRDFMPRNLMIPGDEAPTLPAARDSLPPVGAASPWGGPAAKPGRTPQQQLGVLDFQDAVYGPITYDVASLMRDAFLTWDEDFVIDITIRYWEKARKAGLMDFEDWHSDFGAFYRAVEWMGLQRHLKVAGIFARLTLRDGKPKYLADAPRFIDYIRHTTHRYRELGPFLQLIDKVEGFEAASGYAFGRV